MNYFGDILTNLPTIKDGFATPTEEPGIGASLRPEIWNRDDIIVETTNEGEIKDPEADFYIQTGFGNIFTWEFPKENQEEGKEVKNG